MPDKNEKFVNEFADYMNKFDQIRELAQRFKTSPGSVMEMFFSIGLEALRQTESIMKNEFESKLKEMLPSSIPDELKNRLRNKITLAVANFNKIKIKHSGGFYDERKFKDD